MAEVMLTKDNFEAEVLKSEIPVLADFNAEWCGPCKSMRPMLDELAEGNTKYKIVSIDIDEEDELAEDYEIASIPCLVVFKGGEEVDRSIGLIPKDSIAALMEV